VKIEIGTRAQRQVERINSRWQGHADYPLLFEEELEEAFRDLLAMPHLGTRYPMAKRPHVKRLLLKKSKYHLYYSLERDEAVLIIHSVWSARRKRGPKL
jgi:plasmid stabilization system protein ParE